MVLDSFKELWDSDLIHNYCAGVLDTTLPYYKLNIGLSEDDTYINAGFLLIDLKKWRENNVESLFINFLKKYNGKVLHNDQGIINGVLSNNILIVDPRYNILSTFYEMQYEDIKRWYGIENYYTQDIINKAVKKPVFIHLVDFINGRPWFYENKEHPLYECYKQYVLDSPFKNDVYIKDNRSFNLKLLSIMMKKMPRFLMFYLYKFYRFYNFYFKF